MSCNLALAAILALASREAEPQSQSKSSEHMAMKRPRYISLGEENHRGPISWGQAIPLPFSSFDRRRGPWTNTTKKPFFSLIPLAIKRKYRPATGHQTKEQDAQGPITGRDHKLEIRGYQDWPQATKQSTQKDPLNKKTNQNPFKHTRKNVN